MYFNYDKAIAYIKGSYKYPDINGIVLFRKTKDGVLVSAKVYNLPMSADKCLGRFFGFHIHEGDSCLSDDTGIFSKALNHLNPNNCIHPYHYGDLPPLIENNGYAYMQVLVSKFMVDDIIGRVVIIHEDVDDFVSDPSGNAGERIACGRIEAC